MFSPSLKLHYSVYVNLLSLYHWMQVTLISFHYLIKHDLTNTTLINIYINKLIYYCWTYYLDINHRCTYIIWTYTKCCAAFLHAPYTLAKSSSLAYNSLIYSNPNNFAFKVQTGEYILDNASATTFFLPCLYSIT